MNERQATEQQTAIASQFLNLIPCPIHEDHWYTVETWHVNPVRRGEPERLPPVESPEWGALIKAKLQRRGCWLTIILWANGQCVEVDVNKYDARLAMVEAQTENLALMAAVEQILESESGNQNSD